MANNEKDVKTGAQQAEGTQQEGTNEQPTAIVVQQKTGIGTAVKIVGGLVITAAFTGLGWFLRGIFGGGHDEDETDRASEEAPTEE